MRGIGSPKGGGLPICQGANISSLRDLFIAAIKREEISSPPPWSGSGLAGAICKDFTPCKDTPRSLLVCPVSRRGGGGCDLHTEI